ncbi:MAG: molybdopterin dinucleotide binding domain-containing protein [Candidatus Bathyarchaeota archaeon]|jgi:formylmethanofuran dehydrogenase subunit D
MDKIHVTLNSGRTVQQGVGLEIGKTSLQYFESASYVELSVEDAGSLGLTDGQPVRISTSHGSIVISTKISKGVESGMAFFPYGIWANQVFGSCTGGTGMPAYKGVKASVESAEGEEVLSLEALVKKMRGEA